MKIAREYCASFCSDEEGTVAIELLLVVPILVWAFLSTFVYFDVYRVEANSTRASLTVADMFSREDVPITGAYLDGAKTLLETLTYEDADPGFRITVYRFNAAPAGDDTYRVVWSENRGFGPVLTDEDLNDLDIAERLPLMSENALARSILLETRTQYSAPFSIGIGPFVGTDLEDVTFTTFTVLPPRPAQLCWDDGSGNPPVC